jgi:hypothetical protein
MRDSVTARSRILILRRDNLSEAQRDDQRPRPFGPDPSNPNLPDAREGRAPNHRSERDRPTHLDYRRANDGSALTAPSRRACQSVPLACWRPATSSRRRARAGNRRAPSHDPWCHSNRDRVAAQWASRAPPTADQCIVNGRSCSSSLSLATTFGAGRSACGGTEPSPSVHVRALAVVPALASIMCSSIGRSVVVTGVSSCSSSLRCSGLPAAFQLQGPAGGFVGLPNLSPHPGVVIRDVPIIRRRG